VAVALGVASAVSIVVFIDHVTRRMRIDDTIRRISRRTIHAFETSHAQRIAQESGWNLRSESESASRRATESGFIQEIDVAMVLDALQPGMVARLDVWTGSFVMEGGRLLTVWTEDGHRPGAVLGEGIAVGETRTIEQDPGHGIRQLVDIALRALSPGVNDPTTAADVTRNLARCVRAAFLAGTPTRVWVAANGARLVAPHSPGPEDHLSRAFEPIERAASDEPIVLDAIADSLGSLASELEERDVDGTAIRRRAAAAEAALDALNARTVAP
jgi:uncharacterized membrane protein